MGFHSCLEAIGWDAAVPFAYRARGSPELVAEGPGRQSCASTLEPWRPARVVLEKGA